MSTLHRNLAWGQILPLSVALLGMVSITWYASRRIATHQVAQRMEVELATLERALSSRFTEMERLAESFAIEWRAGLVDPGNPEGCWRVLRPQVASHDLLSAVNLVSMDGTGFGLGRISVHWGGRGLRNERGRWVSGPILGDPLNQLRSDPEKATYAMDVRQRPWFLMGVTRRQGTWTSPYVFVGSQRGEPGISYVYPVRHEQGELLGVLSLDLRLETLSENLASLKPSTASVILAVDAAGHLVALPRQGYLPPTRTDFLRSVDEGHLPLAQDLYRQGGHEPLRLGHLWGGERFYGRPQPFVREGIDWKLMLALPEREVQSGVWRRMGPILVLALGAFLVLGWKALRLSARIAFPLQHLAASAETFGHGASPAHAPGDSDIHEVRTLSRALTMAHHAIQEREHWQGQLRQNQRLEVLGTLAGGIAHDLNNQLTVILGQLELGLTRMDKDSPLHAHFHRAETAARRCASTTRALLTFSRSTPPDLSPVNLNLLVQECLSLISRPLGPGIRVTTALAPNLPIIQGDRALLEQMVLNLILNARDAMPTGGTLSLQTERQEEDVALIVKDTGTGMQMDVRDRIFDPFFTTKPQGKGTGLGLSMALSTVHAHGGHMDVETMPGEGTLMRVVLPIQDAHAHRHEIEPRPLSQGAHLHGMHVLIAEDELLIRHAIAETLVNAGARVVETCDGRDALDRWEANTFDLVIADQLMPRMIGTELLREIRKHAPDQPFLLLSGHGLEGVNTRLAQDPCLQLLPKPFTLAQLLETIHGMLVPVA